MMSRFPGRHAALALAALLLSEALAADSGMFRLFPSTLPRDPLLAPDMEDPVFTLSCHSVLFPEARQPNLFWKDLRMPEQVLLLSDPPLDPLPARVKPRGAGSALKPVLTGLVMATAVGYSAGNSLKEAPYQGIFHYTKEGFFGRNTYNGGVDKMAHFVDYTIAQRAIASPYRRMGYTSTQSGWLGFGTAFAAGLTTEIGDGTTVFGFSWEDLLMDTLGAATAFGLTESGWNDTIGFRFGAVSQQDTPSCCQDYSNIGRDYSGEIYTADLKISGLARRMRFDPGIARFLLVSMTYGTNGYNTASPEIRQRLVGFEVGIHFSEILRSLGVPSEPIWGGVLYFFFDTLRIPYTAIGVRYDLNNHEWFGPTAGRTPFHPPSGSR